MGVLGYWDVGIDVDSIPLGWFEVTDLVLNTVGECVGGRTMIRSKVSLFKTYCEKKQNRASLSLIV